MTMLFLARISLNPTHRDVQRDLGDAAQMHTTLMRLLPDGMGADPRKQANLLFRVENGPTGTTVLAQATQPLHPERLPTGYATADVKDITGLLHAVQKGTAVRYRVDLNPTKSERRNTPTTDAPASGRPPRPRGTVRALSGPAADTWWRQRAADSGLDLHTLLPTNPAWPPRRNTGADRTTIQFTLCRYEGIGTITDPDRLRIALTEGIGRAKPYGAGLLSLLPGRTP
ncbi:type I-E CRISPR-associated protein Cas6/Cse3/CasE [Glycomyces sp. A-F 0318]|uniref:type I-E CRISPR-associated protein Cas6/Cse3/CasE n=1 Tax=Glycomyces amatae TaxID=2881355 RepID=UPI001E58BC74|nr:type I-E CRISPR-associated protein Cas6/Cse3/CasE [Glycomyces amatae]MCD0447508.1 type I-E CRISPR-associated protein Cas6/Cse3/CasE [Glycomyces amatae]